MRSILTFHSVDASGSVISIAPRQLERLLVGIREAGHQILPLRALLDRPPGAPAVALTFDDGMASVLEGAAPVLEEHDAPATLFLTTGVVGATNRWPGQSSDVPELPMLSWSQVEALTRRGFTIEAHSRTHPDLTDISDAQLAEELEEPAAEIEARLGRRPEGFAYPYGYFDDRIKAAAAGTYRYAVTTRFGFLGEARDWMALPRLDTYYLRDGRLRFGGPTHRAYLGLRGWLRRLRRHPGEALS